MPCSVGQAGKNDKYRLPRYPNLIKGMVISNLNQVWLSDITYIRIRTGFVYLDALLRKVIGYAVSTSDQGVQYASGEYVEQLTRHVFLVSMAAAGNVHDGELLQNAKARGGTPMRV
ncbi:hypothetical protein M1N89_01195 [Dehalococcoidia bacterium]|nr:hypothetical protein [Dehalococcoidia bacterium]